MGAIKNVGKGGESIIEARSKKGKFSSIFDLAKSVDLRVVNKKCLESLICAGALDCLQGTRAQLFEGIDKAIEYEELTERKTVGQVNLFDSLFNDSGDNAEASIPEPLA